MKSMLALRIKKRANEPMFLLTLRICHLDDDHSGSRPRNFPCP